MALYWNDSQNMDSPIDMKTVALFARLHQYGHFCEDEVNKMGSSVSYDKLNTRHQHSKMVRTLINLRWDQT